MTPARIAALEACAKAFKKLRKLRNDPTPVIEPYGVSDEFFAEVDRAWAIAEAALDRLEGVSDESG